jgi:Mn-dependent DtxR family transcriptional regulator
MILMEKSDLCCKVYECVCHSPGIKTSKISSKLKITKKELDGAVSDLKMMGLVEIKKEKQSENLENIIYPVKAANLLPNDMKSELVNIQ